MKSETALSTPTMGGFCHKYQYSIAPTISPNFAQNNQHRPVIQYSGQQLFRWHHCAT